MSVVSPSILQYGRVEPYVSLSELTTSPTASLLDFSNFIEGGDQDDQDAAMQQLIVRASSKADVFCMGRLGTLNATVNVEPGRSRIDREGRLVIRPYYTPIVAVNAFQWGPQMPGANQLEVSQNTVWLEREQIVAQVAGPGGGQSYGPSIGALSQIINSNLSANSEMYCTYTYVNGWANSFSTEDVTSGTSTMPVVDSTGVYPNMQLTIWDGVNDETLFVSSSYVPGTDTITFASAMQFNHAAGTNISAMDAAVKQAVIHFVVAMVQERGESAQVLEQMGEGHAESSGGGKMGHELMAYDLLSNFVQSAGRL